MKILAIESSCDETAAAVVEDRTNVLSSVVASQDDVHAKFGGVVPELAARRHVERIQAVIEESLARAESTLDGIDAVAVTVGPGLIGSLLVGVCAAKAIAWHRGLPLLAINHLEGHVRSPFLENTDIEFPAVALVVSGGHTALYLCPEEDVYRLLARTRDDAAGEAFDKVAKLLGLGYPGGPVIDRLSEGSDERRFDFPRAVMKNHSLDFSFSGQKSEARRQAIDLGIARPSPIGGDPDDLVRDFVASFQRSVVAPLVDNTVKACREHEVRTVLLAGGVACNRRLRHAFETTSRAEGLRVHMPSPKYTTDNAAMIGAAAFLHLERRRFASLDQGADANLRLGVA